MIEQVSSRKVMGVTIDNDLLWSEYIPLLGKRLTQQHNSKDNTLSGHPFKETFLSFAHSVSY